MAISKIGSKALVDCSVAAVDIEDGSITGAKLAGSIANAKLANSSITVNGTAINLGASGSLQPVSWQSVVVSDGSTVTTMVAGNGYFVNNTSAAGLVKLPISASAGDTIAIKDYAGNFGTNSLTIQRNGHNIQGVANDSQISTNRASLSLVYVDSTKGWLYAVESNVADLQEALFITATGGTVTESGDYQIHSFTGDGCFVVTQLGNPVGGPSNVDYVVIAGGAGGGYYNGGGGGAGGFREGKQACGSAHSVSPLAVTTGLTVAVQTYPITVGSGGAKAGPSAPLIGTSGGNSIFSTITSAGGGGGNGSVSSVGNGGPGGSGGGAGGTAPGGSGGSGNTPPTSPPQGNNGGGGTGPSSSSGGGGAGSQGNAPRDGGNGVTSSIIGSSAAYSGGGSGAPSPHPAPAVGGTAAGNSGTANTGNGGGGDGGNGGSGIVVIRYKFQ